MTTHEPDEVKVPGRIRRPWRRPRARLVVVGVVVLLAGLAIASSRWGGPSDVEVVGTVEPLADALSSMQRFALLLANGLSNGGAREQWPAVGADVHQALSDYDSELVGSWPTEVRWPTTDVERRVRSALHAWESVADRLREHLDPDSDFGSEDRLTSAYLMAVKATGEAATAVRDWEKETGMSWPDDGDD